MSSIDASTPVDIFPNEAIEEFQKTRPWILFIAIVTMISAIVAVTFDLFMVLIIMDSHFASILRGAHLDRLIIEGIFSGSLLALLSIMQFRFATRISKLFVSENDQRIVDVEHLCRRQLQLWTTLAIIFAFSVTINLFSLIELAAHTTR